MSKKSRKVKTKDFSFKVLNIKLQSDASITIQDYKNIFNSAFTQKAVGKQRGDRSGIIRQLFSSESEGKTYYHGRFCSFVLPDDKALDFRKLEIVDFEIPKNMFINPKEAEFVFYPDLHRIGVKNNSSIGLNSLKGMLENLFSKILPENTGLDISVQQATDGFKSITNAKYISSLHIEISPTNADISKDATEFMDSELKSMQARKMTTDIRPNASGNLVFKDSKVLSGMLGMAQNNGFAKATVIDENDKKKIINTMEHPEKISVTAVNVEEAWASLYNKLKEKFRE